MNFLRKKKNDQKDPEPEQDYGLRFNTNFIRDFCHPVALSHES